MKYSLTVFLLVAAIIALSIVDCKKNDHQTHGSKKNETVSGSHRARRQSEDNDGHREHRGHGRHHRNHDDDSSNDNSGGSSFSLQGKMPNMEDVADAFSTVVEKGQEIVDKSITTFQKMIPKGN